VVEELAFCDMVVDELAFCATAEGVGRAIPVAISRFAKINTNHRD
jgi:hypothetical protein